MLQHLPGGLLFYLNLLLDPDVDLIPGFNLVSLNPLLELIHSWVFNSDITSSSVQRQIFVDQWVQFHLLF